MKILVVEENNRIKYGNIGKIAKYIGVHTNTISRWIANGDRVVFKNGYKIFLKTDKL